MSANHQFNQSFQDLLRDVQKAYYELYSAESDYQAKRADFETARTALNVSKQKLQAGLVSTL